MKLDAGNIVMACPISRLFISLLTLNTYCLYSIDLVHDGGSGHFYVNQLIWSFLLIGDIGETS